MSSRTLNVMPISQQPSPMKDRSHVRKYMIEFARRNQIPGSGSSMSFLLQRTANMVFPNLRLALYPIQYATIGAAATRHYMPERLTNDLDVIISVRDSKEAREKLVSAGFTYNYELSIGGSDWTDPSGFPIDVVENDEKWIEKALNDAQENCDEQGLPVLPLPYLVLMKYRASRFQDIADMGRMLGQASDESLNAVRDVFNLWAPSDLEDLESIIALGKLEYLS